MTELTHSQLLFQGAVGKDHHLRRNRAQVRRPELGGSGEGRIIAESGGRSRQLSSWSSRPLSLKDLLGIRFSQRIHSRENESFGYGGEGRKILSTACRTADSFVC